MADYDRLWLYLTDYGRISTAESGSFADTRGNPETRKYYEKWDFPEIGTLETVQSLF